MTIKKRNIKIREDGKFDTGRPRTFKTPEELQARIDEYFKSVETPKVIKDEEGNPIFNKSGTPALKITAPTVAGMALFLGFEDRNSIYDYKKNDLFSGTIKKAITRIEAYAEEQLTTNGKPVGAIFWLKNHGWIDKVQNEMTGKDGEAIKQSVSIENIKDLKDLLDV